MKRTTHTRQLLIDGQLFQTGAWDRGMGKIAVEFIRALLARDSFTKHWKVTVVLNEGLRDEARDQAIAEAFGGRAEIIHVPLQSPADGGSYRQAAGPNRQVLTERLAAYAGAVYFIPALFEHAVFPVFPDGLRRVLLFHDLIPLLYADHYLRNEELRQGYYERFGEFLSAGLVVANSDTTRNDLLRFLNLDPDTVRTVYGAGFDRGGTKPKPIPELQGKPFILFPSGDDFRKNNERCVRAFTAFNEANDNRYRLVLTSNFSEGTKRSLEAISPDVYFAGVVDEGQFRWLFQQAEAMFWCPQYEGLGMPLLEAMAEGVGRIVCSDIQVFREIADGDPVLFCDPESVEDMTAKLTQAMGVPAATGYAALKVFTWQRTGKLLEAALDAAADMDDAPRERPKIAVVGPDPRGYSSIGKFIQELHPVLSRHFAIDYYFEQSVLTGGEPRTSYLPYVADCADVSTLTAARAAGYDAVWYHIGNSDYHIQTVQRALVYPGYVVVHDTRLRGLFDQLVQRGHISEERYRIEESFEPLRESEFITSLANSAKGLLVHSADAAEKLAVQQIAETANLRQVYHPIGAVGPVAGRSGRPVTIGFGGFATPRSDDLGVQVLRGMLADGRFADCRFRLFGSGFNYDASNQAMAGLLADPRVTVSSDLSDLRFQDILAGTDILFNYRAAYNGETSRFTIEAMRYGACVLVRRIGWYAELPAGAACQATSEVDVIDQAAALVADPERRQRMSEAARTYAAGLTAAGYAQAMREMMARSDLDSYPHGYTEAWRAALSAAGIQERLVDERQE